MKTAISIPEKIFAEADEMAKRLSMSRSELYTRAVEAFLDEHRADRVREALDAVYGDEDSSIDSELAAMQSAAWTEE